MHRNFPVCIRGVASPLTHKIVFNATLIFSGENIVGYFFNILSIFYLDVSRCERNTRAMNRELEGSRNHVIVDIVGVCNMKKTLKRQNSRSSKANNLFKHFRILSQLREGSGVGCKYSRRKEVKECYLVDQKNVKLFSLLTLKIAQRRIREKYCLKMCKYFKI